MWSTNKAVVVVVVVVVVVKGVWKSRNPESGIRNGNRSWNLN